MDTRRVHENTRGEEGTIVIDSFSDARKSYEVTNEGCSCLHSRMQGAYCKHRILRGCLLRIRRSKLSTSHDEEVAREIVSRVLDRTNRLDESHEALNAARSFRFGTSELRKIASQRHRENVRRELARLEAA